MNQASSCLPGCYLRDALQPAASASADLLEYGFQEGGILCRSWEVRSRDTHNSFGCGQTDERRPFLALFGEGRIRIR
jgi:hypothetical protein